MWQLNKTAASWKRMEKKMGNAEEAINIKQAQGERASARATSARALKRPLY